MTSVMVTGGAGSLGREVTLALARAGHRVRVLDLPQADFRSLESAPDLQVVRGSIEDVGLLRRAVQGVDAVVHLAALLPPASERDRERTMRVNAGGTALLIDAMRQNAPLAHIIFTSSVCIYGDTSAETPPVPVTRSPRPVDFYGHSKATAEALVRESGLPYTILHLGDSRAGLSWSAGRLAFSAEPAHRIRCPWRRRGCYVRLRAGRPSERHSERGRRAHLADDRRGLRSTLE